ncbi:M20/M25/M40 family metallo-hydrolase, partial [Mesorhizobium sp. M0676]|uniref:M20/M25/M40 family metallo-hydrolase n=1 Tax=Mesorhizobium sp. M0676 TaxID=2956984 RepID=UPI003337CD0B
VKKRMAEVVAGIAQVTGAKIALTIEGSNAAVFNHPVPTELAMNVAKEVAGEDKVVETPPVLGGEDFSDLAAVRPGAFIRCGNGDSAGLHHAAYDFNDQAIPFGTTFWIKLVENTLAA